MFARLLDLIRGKAITIPPMDGPLRPNNALDLAEEFLAVGSPDNFVRSGERLYFSSGPSLRSCALTRPASTETVATFDAPISAMAAADDGALAVGLDDGMIVLHRAGREPTQVKASSAAGCPTALAFLDPGTLLVCKGAVGLRPSEWARDLIQKGSSGSVWRVDIRSGEEILLGRDLAFPFGVLVEAGRGVVVAESWRHRLVRLPLDRDGRPEPLLTNLPGYPSRLAPASDGGAWLSLFAPRNRLIEFVLQEEDYREAMMREVDPEFWIAPSLHPRQSFLEPLQCGAVRTMGIHKPWAPSRSYGLLVKLDADFRPTASFHSRSDGRRHGVTIAIEAGGRVLVAAKGGNAILELASP